MDRKRETGATPHDKNHQNDLSWAEFLAPPPPPAQKPAGPPPAPPADYSAQVSVRAYERARRGGR
jgi:hypothetical protein